MPRSGNVSPGSYGINNGDCPDKVGLGYERVTADLLGLACCQIASLMEAKLRNDHIEQMNSNHIDAMHIAIAICVREKYDMKNYKRALDMARQLAHDNLSELCTFALESKYFGEVVPEPLQNLIVKTIMEE